MSEQNREREIARFEGERNAASEAYFSARHHALHTRDRECVFAAGYRAAWDRQQARIALLEKVAVHALFYLKDVPDADGYELEEALRAAGYEV